MTSDRKYSIAEALELMSKYRICGVPVGDGRGPAGGHPHQPGPALRDAPRTADRGAHDRERLITVPVGTTLDQAKEILHKHKVEKLLVVDRDYRLKGLITVKDIQKAIKYPWPARTSWAGCAWARRSGSPGTPWTAPGAGGGAGGRAGDRHRARPQSGVLDMVRPCASSSRRSIWWRATWPHTRLPRT